eukprot:jgi/Mesvir1/28567/Mv17838-RA.1
MEHPDIDMDDNNGVQPGGSNAIIIPRASNDTVHVHTMAENWSFQAIGKLLGGQPSLYDILKPLNSSTRLSVGVYYAHPEHGHNQTASKIIGHPIHGDVLLIKTYDDGESPTKVRCITEYDLGWRCGRPRTCGCPCCARRPKRGEPPPRPRAGGVGGLTLAPSPGKTCVRALFRSEPKIYLSCINTIQWR